MISLVERAENYLEQQGAWELPPIVSTSPTGPMRVQLAALRHEIAQTAAFPVIVSTNSNARSLAFARADNVRQISQRGPATPDHILRTKRLPMLGRDVNEYAAAYREYFSRNAPRAKEAKTMLDPAPRIFLDPEFGLGTIGRSAKEAAIARDLYSHTIDVITRAEALGGYRALSEEELFEFEYWDLEQAKLRRAGKPPMFTGEIACVTGAASGIGKACVEALLKRGAAVAGFDIDPRVTASVGERADYLGVQCDVTSGEAVGNALEEAVRAFGGLDMLILNAGIFPAGNQIESLDDSEWRAIRGQSRREPDLLARILSTAEARAARRPGRGDRVQERAGTGAGRGRVFGVQGGGHPTRAGRRAGMGGGRDRVNVVHPNAVFDTGLWTEEVLNQRAGHYGITVEEYKRRNLLRTEVRSADVGKLVAELCSDTFGCTTGAQIPVDGGNERVI